MALAISIIFDRLFSMKINDLPNNIDELKALLIQQDQQLTKQDQQINELVDLIVNHHNPTSCSTFSSLYNSLNTNIGKSITLGGRHGLRSFKEKTE